MKKGKSPTAGEMTELLARRYSRSEWAFFRNVPSTTGIGSSARRADAVALNLYPSRGLELHGFEIKVSRADWLRELKQPEKAEEICQFCDRWWIVVWDKEIVKDGELPPTWGLMIKRGNGLRTLVKAPKIKAEPMDRPFVAVLLRMSRDWQQTPEEQKAAVDLAYEEGKQSEAGLTDLHRIERKRLEERIENFQKASGINIQHWPGGAEIGKAVRMILNRPGHILREAEQFLRSVKLLHENLSEAIEELKAFITRLKTNGDTGKKAETNIPESDRGQPRTAAVESSGAETETGSQSADSASTGTDRQTGLVSAL